jgi:CHAT domain-containing protein
VADTALARADSLYLEGDLETARSIWLAALAAAEARGDSASMATLLTSLGLASRRLAQYPEARGLLEQSLALKQRLGMRDELFRSFNALGLLAENEGRLTDATAFYGQATAAARDIGDSLSAAKAAHNLGLVYGRLGDFERSREGIAALRDMARVYADSVSLARALNNLARLEVATGNALSALALLSEVLRLSRELGDVELEENALGQLAMAYDALGEPPRAFASLDSALALTREHGMRRQEGENLRLLGDLYLEAGDYSRALASYEEGERIVTQLDLPEETGDVLLSIAEAQFALGRIDLARQRAGEALRIHRSGGFRLAEFGDLTLLAELAQASGRAVEARGYLRSTSVLAGALRTEIAAADLALLEARVADRAEDSRRVLTVLDGAQAALAVTGNGTRWEAAALRARAYRRLNLLDAAVVAGRQALDIVERVRGSYASGALRTSYVSSTATVYADQVLALLQLGRVGEAFEVADAGRGRALVERLLVARDDVGRTQGAARMLLESEALLHRIDSLVARIRELEQARPPDDRGVSPNGDERALGGQLVEAQSEYETLLLRARDTDAVGAAVLGSTRTSEVDVRAGLAPDEALLEYMVLPDRLLIFVVTRDSVLSTSSNIGADELVARVRVARELVGRREADPAQAARVLEALHRNLIRPALDRLPKDRVRRLLIVPHGTLAYLPFAALRDRETGEYLVSRYALMFLPTASALAAIRAGARPAAAGRRQSAAFAPLAQALPASRVEAVQFRRSVRDAEALIGARATEAALRAALSGTGAVHVATHGVMNARNPMFSRIELAPGKGDGATDDGRLEVHEVLGLVIRSPLVFLSGCETGLGAAWSTSFNRAEDYATLAQAFLYAGARNVVATLWRVADESSAEFAEYFYAHLGSSAAPEALAAAQRRMLSDARRGAPYHWASYQVSGDGSAMTADAAGLFRSARPASRP